MQQAIEQQFVGSERRGRIERLLEESWDKRFAPATRSALAVEAIAAVAFLAAAILLAVTGLGAQHFRVGLAGALVLLYAAFSRSIKLPIGAGSFVPSYLVLVPMLVLLPPAAAPLLAALGLVVGTLGRWAVRRARLEQVLFAIPDAWHAIGPALVLTLAGVRAGRLASPLVLTAAFLAGCLVDLVASTLREWLTQTVVPSLQTRVIIVVWGIDACVAPLGLLIAYAASRDLRELLLLLVLAVVFLIINHDRRLRIADNLRVAGREHDRVQAAVKRVSEALASRPDVGSLGNVVLGAALEALCAESGHLLLGGDLQPVITVGPVAAELRPQLDAATGAAWANSQPYYIESNGGFAIAMPLNILGRGDGAVAVARRGQEFGEDERLTFRMFIEQVELAVNAAEPNDGFPMDAVTDRLTGIGNRRKLAADLNARLTSTRAEQPLVLGLFDLGGFNAFNERFGHPAGDAMLTKLASQLALSVSGDGGAYRVGGDEFVILTAARSPAEIVAASEALSDRTTPCLIAPSLGSVLIPREATNLEEALALAYKRMYEHKRKRSLKPVSQSHPPLSQIA